MIRIVRAADCRKMPWKNGGGTTTEIAVSPAGAGLDDFDWRVSMARVEAGGPFSSFAGIDRTLCVLEGEGIVLDIAGRDPTMLGRMSGPLSFPADVPTSAALDAGPITDFNVMTRRGRMRHAVEHLALSASIEVAPGTHCTLFFCHQGKIRLGRSPAVELEPLDTALVRDAATVVLEPATIPATVFVVRIDNAGANG